MPGYVIVILIITAIMVATTIVLYFLGKKADKKRAEQEQEIKAAQQQTTMLIIDKKKVKRKNSGLPEQVIASTPWYAKRAKLPVVKAKVGPKVVTLIAAAEIYEDIPVKKEVKATVSGLYITGVKGLHGKIEHKPHKKTFREKMMDKLNANR